VTGAHLNRLPDEIGVWRFDPETETREVVREPTSLAPREPGIEPLDRGATKTNVRVVSVAEKARIRRRLAERAYGKGWRTYGFPSCEEIEPHAYAGTNGLPYCRWKGRFVHPAAECGISCPGHDPGEPPDADLDRERDRRSPWVRDPEGRRRQQTGLGDFS